MSDGELKLPDVSQTVDSAPLQVSPDSPKMVMVEVGSKVRVTKLASLFLGQNGTIREISKPVPPRKGQHNKSDITPYTWFLVEMDDKFQFPDGGQGDIWFREDEISPL